MKPAELMSLRLITSSMVVTGHHALQVCTKTHLILCSHAQWWDAGCLYREYIDPELHEKLPRSFGSTL